MKNQIKTLVVLALLALVALHLSPANAQTTAITYQGQLNDSNGPVTGTYDMVFNLYQVTLDPTNSAQPIVTNLVATTSNLMVNVSQGLFTTMVDFGKGTWASIGDSVGGYQLECGVRPGGSTIGFALLAPQQQITPSPLAQYAYQAGYASGGAPWSSAPGAAPNFAFGRNVIFSNSCSSSSCSNGNLNLTTFPTALLTGVSCSSVQGAVIAGGGTGITNYNAAYANFNNQICASWGTVSGGASNNVNQPFGTVAGGFGNVVSGALGSVGGGQNNTAGGYASCVLGGYANSALCAYDAIVGGVSNTVSGDPSFIGAGTGNTIIGAGQVAVGGLPYNSYIVAGWNNTVNADESGIGGGVSNRITTNAFCSSIVGGYGNLIASNVTLSLIGGGTNNQIYAATNNPAIADVLGGGQNNIITNANYATLSGGAGNWVYAYSGTIPGGWQAVATNFGQMAYASGKFTSSLGAGATTAPGNAQSSLYVLRNVTTNTTASYLFLDGSGSEINLPTNRACTFSVKLVGIDQSHYACGYAVRGTAVGTGSVFLTENPSVVGNMPVMPTAPSITVSGSLLHIQAHGVPTGTDTIRWVATVETAEVAW